MRLLGIHGRRAVVVQHTAMMLLCLYARKLSLSCCEMRSAWRCDVFYDRSDGATPNGQLFRLQPWLNAMNAPTCAGALATAAEDAQPTATALGGAC